MGLGATGVLGLGVLRAWVSRFGTLGAEGLPLFG